MAEHGTEPDGVWLAKPLVWVERHLYIERVRYTKPTIKLGEPDQVADWVRPFFRNLPHERMLAIYGDAGLRMIGARVLGEGTHALSLMDTPALLRGAAFTGASMVVLAHNHPNQTLQPSSLDTELTQKVALVCWAADLQLVDHLILPTHGPGYYSYGAAHHPALVPRQLGKR